MQKALAVAALFLLCAHAHALFDPVKSVLGVALPFSPDPSVAASKGCCLETPRFQFNASIVIAGEEEGGAVMSEYVQVDRERGAVFAAVHLTRTNLSMEAFTSLILKGAGGWVNFITSIKKPGKCFTAPVPHMPAFLNEVCFDTPMVKVHLGSTEAMVYQKYPLAAKNNTFTAVAVADCLPLAMTCIGIDTDEQEMVAAHSLFYDQLTRVKDAGKFYPPAGCIPIPPHLMHPAIEKRFDLINRAYGL